MDSQPHRTYCWPWLYKKAHGCGWFPPGRLLGCFTCLVAGVLPATGYAELAAATARVSFIGRLATYRYYNMDQVVGMALHEFEKIEPALSTVLPGRCTMQHANEVRF
jgi:hypothetical protein